MIKIMFWTTGRGVKHAPHPLRGENLKLKKAKLAKKAIFELKSDKKRKVSDFLWK
jgi:hypothetical protein